MNKENEINRKETNLLINEGMKKRGWNEYYRISLLKIAPLDLDKFFAFQELNREYVFSQQDIDLLEKGILPEIMKK